MLGLAIVTLLSGFAASPEVSLWMSSEDGAYQLTPRESPRWTTGGPEEGTPTIEIDPATEYQRILGLGASLDHATCYNLSRLPAEKRAEVITRLVDPERGIGMNLMRLCIGTSDFVGEPYYSYDDLPEGQRDPELAHFSIEKDRAYLLPVVKEALAKNPDLLFFASPWSPPGWMKTTESLCGGKLEVENQAVYAQYLLKFLDAYGAEGIPIHAITPQNEPGFPNPDYPTCLWRAELQRDFIRDHLGPALRASGHATGIWCWDHNWNRPGFPRTVLSDPKAAQYVDGTGFHLYEGDVEAQSAFRDEFPGKHIYFTEGSTFRTRGAVRIIGILRHWARSYNAWVIMLDERRKPNNGPHSASRTCIELLDDLSVAYHFDYYMYGQFMKFIPRGALRIASSGLDDVRFAHVAFRTPDGRMVLVVANANREAVGFAVRCAEGGFQARLDGKSVATFRWRP